jgi:MFS family permease
MLAVGAVLTVATLLAFGASGNIAGVFAAFVLVQVAASVAQAPQQALLPDLVTEPRRGVAAGVKGLADVGGAFVGFLVLGLLLATGDVAPALVFAGGAVVVTALIAIVLVQEPRPASPHRGRLDFRRTYRLDLQADRRFIGTVVARFFFLLGTFAVGRFLLLFVADRLGLDPASAADATGGLLAALTLLTAIASVPFGWLCDRVGRMPTMVVGSFLGAAGALLLATADGPASILVFGGVMALGSAAFTTANWAQVADLASPSEAGRYLGIGNFGTAGAAAAAGLFGPLADAVPSVLPGTGFTALFVASALAMALSGFVAIGVASVQAGRSDLIGKTDPAIHSLSERSIR